MTQIQPQGIVEQLNQLTISKIKANALLVDLKQELETSELYKRIKKGEEVLKELTNQEVQLKEQGKNILMSAGMKKFEALDGTIIQLNKKPGKLVIENEDIKELDSYRKEKITILLDKKAIKDDIKEGLIIEGVSISEDYELVIKTK